MTATTRYIDVLKLYDGVITPDCTMMIGQSPCLQQANTYMNRAVGFYLQRQGIPVIPNIRWSDVRHIISFSCSGSRLYAGRDFRRIQRACGFPPI
ncbi:MAG: DUF4417 domain-containing protein [Blautia sp.]|nr:DUF4417 domain-containing protein [Blautia sp.]